MYLKSEKIKLVEKGIVNYVKNNEQKQLYKIEVGDINTGITEDVLVPKDRIDILKDINKGDTMTLILKNRQGRFELYNIIKEK